MELNLLWTLLLFSWPKLAYGACTAWPAPFASSTWHDSAYGTLVFGSNTLSGYEVTSFGIAIAAYTCQDDSQFTSNGILLFRSTNTFTGLGFQWYLYVCMKLTKITNYSYTYYLQRARNSNAGQHRVRVHNLDNQMVTDICDSASGMSGSEFITIVKDGFEDQTYQDCPTPLMGRFEFNYTSAGGKADCNSVNAQNIGNIEQMDVCTDHRKLDFKVPCNNMTNGQSIVYASADVYCITSLTIGSNTFIQLLNPEASPDNNATYKFSCMVISSDSRKATVVYNNCTDQMTPTVPAVDHTGATIGARIDFFPYVFCPCNDGTFGDDCKETCDNCLYSSSGTCSNVDGKCKNGCKAGYMGDYCNTKCPDGKWGESCLRDCGGCLNGVCNATNGYCSGGCKPGYLDSQRCERECDNGSFGVNCAFTCSEDCDGGCDGRDGKCKFCKAGFTGDFCDQECSSGKWGANCGNICGGGCKDGICDSVSGQCTGECNSGFKFSDYCNATCEDSTYGTNCSEQCAHCKQGTFCSKVDGSCTNGCKEGYTGTLCDVLTAPSVNDETKGVELPVVFGVVSSVIALISTAACVFLLYERRKRSRASETQRPSININNEPNVARNNNNSSNNAPAAGDRVNDYESITVGDTEHVYNDIDTAAV